MLKDNQKISVVLEKFANELESIGESPYRVRAYRRAAKSILKFPKSITELVKADEVIKIPFVGDGIAIIINNYIKNNKLPVLRRKPKKIIDLSKQQNQETVKKYKKLLSTRRQLRLFRIIPVVESILEKLKRIPQIKAAECVGGFRRKQEIVSHIDILFVASSGINLLEKLNDFPEIQEIIKINSKKTIVKLYNGLLIAFNRISAISYGSGLLAVTGSQQHYDQLQELAVRKNLNLSSQGLYKGKKRLDSKTEQTIYTHLDLSYIEPELRENRGEILQAQKRTLPRLIELKDIKGDLHSHTTETDGTESLETMVHAAIQHGYEYFAITDHSQHLAITNGLDAKRLLAQIRLIDKLNTKLAGKITILKSMEVDILEDGMLDLPNSVLKELDLRVCSVHSRFRLPAEKQTERILRAMDNPYFNILGHPTGRLIRKREPYALDMERIFKAAKERNCFFELNGQPYRLDLNDEYCRMAKEIGLKIAISSDAHSTKELNFMRYGVYQARRGWLEAEDVINTCSLKELLILLKRT